MPVIKSSKKRALQTVKRTARNARLKKDIREASQAFEASLAGGRKAEITKTQSQLSSLLDRAAKKNVFHKNKTARRKARIAKLAKSAAPAKKSPKTPKKS